MIFNVCSIPAPNKKPRINRGYMVIQYSYGITNPDRSKYATTRYCMRNYFSLHRKYEMEIRFGQIFFIHSAQLVPFKYMNPVQKNHRFSRSRIHYMPVRTKTFNITPS